ncbi:MAG: molybdopterin-dependent oxidoreductase [Pseudomonadota bacterium]|nr:molybdopterin-dependent oxidoreductase [Pseudomonadota bacterium]
MVKGYFDPIEEIDTSPLVADEIKDTTCYMCTCKCGIKVHLKNGGIRFIEGNKHHPTNKGVLCAKGAAGIMNQFSPAKLNKPLKRVGERGLAKFVEIEWAEALETANGWLQDIRNTNPKKLAFITGGEQDQALTEWWASQFGTPNYSVNGGLCSVNMETAGRYTVGGSFWDSGEPDWKFTKYFLMFGVSEGQYSNPIKAGLSTLRKNGGKFISLNPIRTGYSAIADEWVGIRPGSDGKFVLALVHELLKSNRIDLDYIVRYSNLPWLVIQDPGGPKEGLFARGLDGEPLCWDSNTRQTADAQLAGITPSLIGEVSLSENLRAVPAFELMAKRYLQDDFSPEAAEIETGIPASTIRRIANEITDVAFNQQIEIEQTWIDWAGRQHDKMIGRPVSVHAMRGISAHSNGFQTCRAIHLLQILLGSIDCPGGWRYKIPFPKPTPPTQKPTGKENEISPNLPLTSPPLGFPLGPQDLLVDPDGTPLRIDHAFSWNAPLATQGVMQMVITNANDKNPYPIDLLFLHKANLSWNSSMNTTGTMEMLTVKDETTGDYRIPKIICSDTYFSETVAYADLVLPDTTYLERWDCMSLLDSSISSADAVADSIRQPVVTPDADTRPFQEVLLDLGTRLEFPGLVKKNGKAKYPKGYVDFLTNHERVPGIGMLAGWRGKQGDNHGAGPPNENQLKKYIENGCFWEQKLPPDQLYFKHANKNYLDYAASMDFVEAPNQIVFQVYSEPLQKFRLAAKGHGDILPPHEQRERIETYFDPLPFWYSPFEDVNTNSYSYPLHALTQRPMAMYNSSGSQNAWLRQIHGTNPLYMNCVTAKKLDINDNDWVWIISHHNRIKGRVKLMEGVHADTVWTWNAIGKRSGSWNLDPRSPEAKTGFLINHLISEYLPQEKTEARYANADPITGQAAWYDLRVKIEKCEETEDEESRPIFEELSPFKGLPERPKILRYGRMYARSFQNQAFGEKNE